MRTEEEINKFLWKIKRSLANTTNLDRRRELEETISTLNWVLGDW